MGRPLGYPSRLGTGVPATSRLGDDHASPNPRRRDDSAASGANGTHAVVRQEDEQTAKGAKITLRFVNEDGSHWRSVEVDRSLIERAKPFAAAGGGRTIEQYIADCLEMAADNRPSPTAPAKLASPEPVRPATAPDATGSVTVPVTMPLALYRRILAMTYYDSGNTSLDVGANLAEAAGTSVDCWLQGGGPNPSPAAYLAKFERELDAGRHSAVYPPRKTVELDALASDVLQRTVTRGSEFQEAGEDPRDLVNAAVTYYLCDQTNHLRGAFDLDDGAEALQRAKGDRLAGEQKGAL